MLDVEFHQRAGRSVGVQWSPRGLVAHVWTRRRLDGETVELPRGRIRAVHQIGEDRIVDRTARMVWLPTDYDHCPLPLVVGDYLDAERALLDATAALDEE
jgi:hypothetical protein